MLLLQQLAGRLRLKLALAALQLHAERRRDAQLLLQHAWLNVARPLAGVWRAWRHVVQLQVDLMQRIGLSLRLRYVGPDSGRMLAAVCGCDRLPRARRSRV